MGLCDCVRIKRGKKGIRKQYHLPYNINAVGKNIKWGRGEGVGNYGEENQKFK